MKKIYRTFSLKESEIINDIDIINHSFYFVSEYVESICCLKAEAISENKVLRVFYYSDTIDEKVIISFHQNNYPNVSLFSIYIRRRDNDYMLKNFWEGVLFGYVINTYYSDGRTNISQEFNSNFELTEYRAYQYNNKGEEIGVKIFYPDSWTIHEEDSIT